MFFKWRSEFYKKLCNLPADTELCSRTNEKSLQHASSLKQAGLERGRGRLFFLTPLPFLLRTTSVCADWSKPRAVVPPPAAVTIGNPGATRSDRLSRWFLIGRFRRQSHDYLGNSLSRLGTIRESELRVASLLCDPEVRLGKGRGGRNARQGKGFPLSPIT